jgi:hypothetical protein
LVARILLDPVQHLVRCHNDFRGIFETRVIDKMLWINYSDSMSDYSMGPVSSGEGWVAEVSDYFGLQ